MKVRLSRLTLCLCFLFVAFPAAAQFRTGASYQDLNDSETVRAFKGHVSFLSAAILEGRKAGSEGERLAAEYFSDKLKEYGVDILTDRKSVV